MKIQEVAAQTGLGIHALRYYEQIGLITPVMRQGNGHRTYTQDDVYRLNFVTQLRSTGMPIAEIKRYNDLAQQGEATVLDDPHTPLEETLAALDQLVTQGKVRYIGASSMYAWEFMRALSLSERNGWARFVSMQNHTIFSIAKKSAR